MGYKFFFFRKTHFKRQFQNLEITHESSEIEGEEKVTQRAKTHQTYLSRHSLELQLEKNWKFMGQNDMLKVSHLPLFYQPMLNVTQKQENHKLCTA